jgi:cyclic pyranopterin phosphate synthase
VGRHAFAGDDDAGAAWIKGLNGSLDQWPSLAEIATPVGNVDVTPKPVEADAVPGSAEITQNIPKLTHLDESGAARMVDVGAKAVTARTAVAAGTFHTTAEVTALLHTGGLPKGDALAAARIAGIMAAKRTPDLIPLCHQIALTAVDVEFRIQGGDVEMIATARSADRTGVEMEALTAVSIAGLTLHDMVKAVDPRAMIGDIRLLEKTGGRSGHWQR